MPPATDDMHPGRRRLVDLVEMGAKRVERAGWKLRRANVEADAAAIAAEAARRDLAAWDLANPDPQLSLIDAINSKGDQA